MGDLTFVSVVVFWWMSLLLLVIVAFIGCVFYVGFALVSDGIHYLKMKRAKRRLKMLTWRCHICNEERPDAYIGVISKSLNIPGIEAEQNVRFCNDKSTCIKAAETYSFISDREDGE
ncbi:MAG: hypothetical protein KAI64_05950 [Thermoplasmata archaeon]|nr:hypothetical protein [Thermoplasmata archaeon]